MDKKTQDKEFEDKHEEHDEEMEDVDDDDDEEEGQLEIQTPEDSEKDAGKKKGKGKKSGRTSLSGRGVTLKMLLDDGVLAVEEGCMSIDYLGQRFVADLLENGKIKWEGSEKLFNSPSAWAIHCKKLVNPTKKSGCGWASVKYKGKKLDQYKSTWFRKQRPLFQSDKISTPVTSPPSVIRTPAISTALKLSGKIDTTSAVISPVSDSSRPSLSSPEGLRNSEKSTPTSSYTKIVSPTDSTSKKELSQKIKNKTQRQQKERSQDGKRKGSSSQTSKTSAPKRDVTAVQSDLADLSSFTTPRKTKLVSWSRTTVSVSEVRPDSDPQTLVQCINFNQIKKTQPFTVSINTNTLMLMDLHCHLTTGEVVGYLGGYWDRDKHSIQIVQAFPVKCRFANQKNADVVQEEIRLAMRVRGLTLVGWYHSHPTYQPDPSVRDIAAQQHYQACIKVEKTSYEPCVGFIVSPYDPHLSSRESLIKAFWVHITSNPGTQTFSLPMELSYSIEPSGLLTDDLLTEMRHICSYYKGSPDAVNFAECWLTGVSFLDKVKASLTKKFPKDQSGRLNNFIHMLLS
ncbi:MPN domain-containing protein-like [Dendronephthya gigantea]|uniref:MPN domain-containing protein-like n=1 Tax=Dendronephthya gigantea TaxID=151771 RepID=UPI001069304B|nr:MPN domain-containing protein-like [Dendronephthya gigantea]XP_028392986.1 MPN domain-containing protein-like [Dendronephthya gigantea]XP_028392987.1 MPN domain-containing protein-like [Dendronephthya gigantea]